MRLEGEPRGFAGALEGKEAGAKDSWCCGLNEQADGVAVGLDSVCQGFRGRCEKSSGRR